MLKIQHVEQRFQFSYPRAPSWSLFVLEVDWGEVNTISAKDAFGNPITDFTNWGFRPFGAKTPFTAILPSFDPLTGIFAVLPPNNVGNYNWPSVEFIPNVALSEFTITTSNSLGNGIGWGVALAGNPAPEPTPRSNTPLSSFYTYSWIIAFDV